MPSRRSAAHSAAEHTCTRRVVDVFCDRVVELHGPERCCTQRGRSGHTVLQFPKHDAAATVNNRSAGMWALPPLGSRRTMRCAAQVRTALQARTGQNRTTRQSLRREYLDSISHIEPCARLQARRGWSAAMTARARCCRHVDKK
jgi:hypothetical protein